MTPLVLRILAVPLVVVGLLVGLWFAASVLGPTYWWSIGLGVAWFVIASFLLGRLTKARPDLRPPVRLAYLGTVAVLAFGFWWTSVRETEVDEVIAVGAPAPARGASPGAAGEDRGGDPVPARRPRGNVQVAAGRVESLAHSGEGRAAVVELARGGRVLTLSDFDIDPGPRVVVRLVAGGEAEGGDVLDLGDLKGSKGDQQYDIPPGADLTRHDLVVFWCVPFTQALAQARLRPT